MTSTLPPGPGAPPNTAPSQAGGHTTAAPQAANTPIAEHTPPKPPASQAGHTPQAPELAALAVFDRIIATLPGLRPREGQRMMAAQVARTLASADLGKPGDDAPPPAAAPRRAIAVIQAGTGVGKSLAYSAPAIALALERNTRVVISTATVALQEQLVHKDLPALAQQLGVPLRFVLAKGRGRFVCKLKLERLSGTGDTFPPPGSDGENDHHQPGAPELDDDLFPDAPPPLASAPTDAASRRHAARQQAALQAAREIRIQLYASMADALARGQWDGERDSLPTPPPPEVWSAIAAEGHTCTGRHCPSFSACTYYARRKEMVAAHVIVANHDLLLSSLGARLLPEVDNCLLILDEAHHLPHTALAQFASHMDLSRLQWLDRLTSRALRVGQLMEVAEIADIPNHSAGLRQHLAELARQVMELYGPQLRQSTTSPPSSPPGTPGGTSPGAPTHWPRRARVPRGELPAALLEPLHHIVQHATGFLEALRAIAKALRNAMRDHPQQAQQLTTLYAQTGALAPRLEAVHHTAQLLLQHPPLSNEAENIAANGAPGSPPPTPTTPPHAKWFTLEMDGEFIALQAHASPILPGAALRHHLWGQVRGAVLTSATLTSCGHFDFFLREAGLHADPAVQTLDVPSPFRYAAQGTLVAHTTRADPGDASRFTPEMVQRLLTDLSQVRAGALVLFTSREQMRQAVEQLPTALRDRVLVQNAMPRPALLAAHRQRVAQGQPSIIFGMQSFGEGLDLPGVLCETLFITKLPFAPPDDPVGEARSEWLRTSGRNPFVELVVPATAIRLAQWTGRAIRTEDDVATIHCYDRRLTTTPYGQQLLHGLPPFTLQHRPA